MLRQTQADRRLSAILSAVADDTIALDPTDREYRRTGSTRPNTADVYAAEARGLVTLHKAGGIALTATGEWLIADLTAARIAAHAALLVAVEAERHARPSPHPSHRAVLRRVTDPPDVTAARRAALVEALRGDLPEPATTY